MFKFTIFCFFSLFVSGYSLAQINDKAYVTVDKLNVQFSLKNHVEYHNDTTRVQPFQVIKKNSFKTNPNPPVNLQSKLWFKFYLNPTINAKRLIFSPSIVDSTTVYIPYKKEYKKFTLGMLTDRDVNFSIYEASILNIPLDSIDLNQPIYFNKVFLTKIGQKNSQRVGYVVLANNPIIWRNKKESRLGYSKDSTIFLAVFGIAMLIFLFNYFVSKDQNFLNYCLYLLFTILIFSSQLPFLINFFNNIHYILLNCVSTISIILASACYFYFVVYFLNVKEKFTKIYPIVQFTILGSLIFTVFVVIQMFFMPYMTYRFIILDIYNVLFLIISIFVFLYLIVQQLSFLHRIILFGSFLLIIGQLLSLILNEAYFFIGAVVLEIIVFSTVVSYQNKLSSELRLLSEVALEKERIERVNLEEIDQLKSRFITNITHEFRTPLTIILGYVNNLKPIINKHTEEKDQLAIIEKNGKNLLGLVNQMLDLAKIEQGKLFVTYESDNIVTFTHMIVEGFKNYSEEKSIELTINSTLTNPILDFDKEKIRQILTNLLSNAIKFTPLNGSINIYLSEEKDNYLIQVKDSGVGISESDLKGVFNRFFQVENNTSKVSQGTGVGLAISKELTELMNGRIWATSIENEGSTFSLLLPIIHKSNCQKIPEIKNPTTSEHVYNEVTNSMKLPEDVPVVLVVEDNRDVSGYIVSCLQKQFKLEIAFNGKSGLKKAIEKIPDIIISDVMMPQMDGFEMTKLLQNHEATDHIPIILLTSKELQEDKLAGIESGAEAYLTKPFQKEELLLRLSKILEKRKLLQRKNSSNHEVSAPKNKTQDKNSIFIEKVISCIHEHLNNTDFGPSELAIKLGFSDSQLYRKLKAITNTSTAKFIRSVRLEQAKIILQTSDKSVAEIAYATGFADPNWFGKAFKEHFSITPSNFRNRNNSRN